MWRSENILSLQVFVRIDLTRAGMRSVGVIFLAILSACALPYANAQSDGISKDSISVSPTSPQNNDLLPDKTSRAEIFSKFTNTHGSSYPVEDSGQEIPCPEKDDSLYHVKMDDRVESPLHSLSSRRHLLATSIQRHNSTQTNEGHFLDHHEITNVSEIINKTSVQPTMAPVHATAPSASKHTNLLPTYSGRAHTPPPPYRSPPKATSSPAVPPPPFKSPPKATPSPAVPPPPFKWPPKSNTFTSSASKKHPGAQIRFKAAFWHKSSKSCTISVSFATASFFTPFSLTRTNALGRISSSSQQCICRRVNSSYCTFTKYCNSSACQCTTTPGCCTFTRCYKVQACQYTNSTAFYKRRLPRYTQVRILQEISAFIYLSFWKSWHEISGSRCAIPL